MPRPRSPQKVSRLDGMTLEWPGRKFRRDTGIGAAKAHIKTTRLETFSPRDAQTGGRIVFGEAADVASALAGEGLLGKVDLVYIDPPFASQADYVHEARLDGRADGRVVRSLAYEDTWGIRGMGEYLDALAPALEGAMSLLSPRGTLWVHLDWRAAYLVRVLLDELFGRDAFLNEIVWRRAPNLGRQAASNQFGRTLDTLLVYGGPQAKLMPPTRLEPIEKSAIRWDDEGRPFTTAPRGDYTDASIERLDQEGRVYRAPSGKVYVKYFLVKNADGALCRERRVDALWTDVPPLRHVAVTERTGFPTQKPRALLERIIASATEPGALVVDLFAGSGTTADAAHALGRRFVLGDAGPLAIATSRARLLRAGAALAVDSCGGALPEGDAPTVKLHRAPRGAVKIELIAPREPAAWAVDSDHDPSQPFRGTWHSERGLGKKPAPAAREAILDAPGARIAVRVYGDDGRVSTAVLGASDAVRAAGDA